MSILFWTIIAIVLVVIIVVGYAIMSFISKAKDTLKDPLGIGKSTPRGAGRPASLLPCSTWNSSWRDDGTSCWEDTIITGKGTGRGAGRPASLIPCSNWDSSWRDDGTSCWSDAHIFAKSSYGRGAGYAIWSEADCKRENPQGCEQNGLIWYPKCRSGFSGNGPVCWQTSCPSGYADDGALCRKIDVGIKKTVFDRYSCNSDEELNGAVCYPKCPAGTTGNGPMCWKNSCPDGYTDDGATCRKDGKGITKTVFDRYSCRHDEELNGALCYPKCQAGYRGEGPVCWEIKK